MSVQLLPKWTAVQTSAYTASLMDAVLCNTSGGTFPVTLPAVSGSTNKVVRVKWRAGTVPPTVVAASGRTIDASWTGFGQVGDSADFSDDGTVWNLV